MIVIALTGIGMVSAQDKGTADTKTNKFATKVANILEIDVTKVNEAFKQAREDIRDEMIAGIEAKLSIMVENGDVTKEEAAEKIDYLKNKKSAFPFKKFHHHKKDLAYKHKMDKGGWLDKDDWADKAKFRK